MKRMAALVLIAVLTLGTAAGGTVAYAAHVRTVRAYAARALQTTAEQTAIAAATPQTSAPNAQTEPVTTTSAPAATNAQPAAVTSTTRTTEVSRGVRKPLAGHVVFVDPGHGIPGSGANGPNGGDEAANNLSTALMLRDMLTSAGARVVMSRTSMVWPIVPGVTYDQLEARTYKANVSGAEIFVSLHENMSETNPEARGLTVYYRDDSRSARLASAIRWATLATTGWYDWGTDVGPYYVLNHSQLKAAVLVESGFLSNATDEWLLGTTSFRRRIATGVYNGILAYFGG